MREHQTRDAAPHAAHGTALPPKKPTIVHHLKHSPAHKTKTAKSLKLAAAVLGFAALIALGLFVYFNIYKPIVKNAEEAHKKAAQLVQQSNQTDDYRTIKSTLGFSLVYSSKTFTAEGQVTDPKSTDTRIYGQSYTGNDLDVPRDYSLVEFSLPDVKSGAYTVAQPEMTILTNIRSDYFTAKEALPANKGKSDLDILAATIGANETADGFVAGTSTQVAINGTVFRQVIYTQTDESYGIPTTTTDIHYYAVQNGRPYTIEISGVHDGSSDAVSLYQSIIQTISFSKPDASKLSARVNVLASQTAPLSSLPSGSANVPSALDPDTILKVVARNQPAVARIGAAECADISLLLPNGSVGATLDTACNVGIGSGSFVSRDGYIATNGHVAKVGTANLITGYAALAPTQSEEQQRLYKILNYLVASGTMSASEVNAMIAGVRAKDQNAINKLDQIGSVIPDNLIKVSDDHVTYAIQTSDSPMHISITSKGVEWNYSRTIIPAAYIDSDIDPQVLKTGMAVAGSTHSDVAILKAKGTFPTVQLGTTAGLKDGDELTAIGFPAFVDNGLDTTKTRTIPSITQGFIEDIETDSTHKLLVTTVPIGHGNSGGPAFDNTGKQIGLNTYGNITCPDQNCFGSGTARDIADYTALLTKDNITIKTDSPISDDWSAGLDAYIAGDYQTAKDKFTAVGDEYPANYLAAKFAALASSQIGSSSDTSSVTQARSTAGSLALWLGSVTLAILLILGTYLIRVSQKHHKLLAAQHAMQPAAPVPAPQAPNQQPPSPQQPSV